MQGVVNAAGVGAGTDTVLFGVGVALSGCVFITLVTALTFTFRATDVRPARKWRDIALRACGSWIAAIGLMMGGFALAS